MKCDLSLLTSFSPFSALHQQVLGLSVSGP